MNSKRFLSYLQRYAAHLESRRHGREQAKDTKATDVSEKPKPVRKQAPTEIHLEQ